MNNINMCIRFWFGHACSQDSLCGGGAPSPGLLPFPSTPTRYPEDYKIRMLISRAELLSKLQTFLWREEAPWASSESGNFGLNFGESVVLQPSSQKESSGPSHNTSALMAPHNQRSQWFYEQNNKWRASHKSEMPPSCTTFIYPFNS
jgi:hypothetical protein